MTDKQTHTQTHIISSCRLDPFCRRGRVKTEPEEKKHTLMLRYDVYTLSSETMEEARLELHRTMQYQDNINTPLLVSYYIKTTKPTNLSSVIST